MNLSLFLRRRYHVFNRRGQSLIELVVAIAIGTVMILAAITVIAPALKSSSQIVQSQMAGAAGKELMDTVRGWSEKDWHNIFNLSKTSSNPYLMIIGSSSFAVATGTETVPSDGVTSGLIGAWRFDEATGTSAFDYSGNNTLGFWQGAAPYYASGTMNTTAGNFGGGGNNYLRLTSSTSNALKQSLATISVSAWVYPTANVGGIFVGPAIISDMESVPTAGGWGVYLKDGNITVCFQLSGVCIPKKISSVPVPLNKWSHIAVSYDGSLVTGYLNGQPVGTVALSGTIGASPINVCVSVGVQMGYSFDNGCAPAFVSEGYFPGRIDDLRVYNRAITQTEIQKIYSGGFYTRYFYVDNVMRNASGYIDPTGSIDDPSTQKVTVVYSWPSLSTARSFVSYLTRYQSRVADQSDWTGAGGQSTSTRNFGNTFATSTNVDYSTSTGSVVIQGF